MKGNWPNLYYLKICNYYDNAESNCIILDNNLI